MKIYCQLKGSTFCEGQDFLRTALSTGMDIPSSDMYLIREPANVYDSNCTQVWCRYGGRNIRLGNVNRENAPLIASCLDSGGTARITSHTFYGLTDGKENVGLYFVVHTACS